jgi:hypothetical protein
VGQESGDLLTFTGFRKENEGARESTLKKWNENNENFYAVLPSHAALTSEAVTNNGC